MIRPKQRVPLLRGARAFTTLGPLSVASRSLSFGYIIFSLNFSSRPHPKSASIEQCIKFSDMSQDGDFIMPRHAVAGDVLVLTKPLGTQVAVNAKQWMRENRPIWADVQQVRQSPFFGLFFSQRTPVSLCRRVPDIIYVWCAITNTVHDPRASQSRIRFGHAVHVNPQSGGGTTDAHSWRARRDGCHWCVGKYCACLVVDVFFFTLLW